jgi:hypothetical protein
LAAHLRADDRCEKRDELQEGVTDSQEKQLRARKKTGEDRSETEKWAESYRVLFPDDVDVPNPCR